MFKDRYDAGFKLGEALLPLKDENPVVIALPRGGVVVGYEVAMALNAPLDVIVVRKLGVPQQPELGFGAIASNGVRVLNWDIIRYLNIPDWQIEGVTEQELIEKGRRLELYRQSSEPPDVTDRTVILVDDGLATGVTAQAGIMALKQGKARKIILAVPVAAVDTVRSLRAEVDDVVALETPRNFSSVSLWYEQFDQTSDAEVLHLLSTARQIRGERKAGGSA